MRAVIATLTLLILSLGPMAVNALAAEAPASEDARQEPARAFPPAVGFRYMQGLADNFGNLTYYQAAVAAQLEQQGLLTPGTADAILSTAGLPPDRTFHDYQPLCDVDRDGVDDFLSNDYFPDGRSRVVVFSGATGKQIWLRDNQLLMWSGRQGAPPPLVADNTNVLLDANGDGVCDILTYGMRREGIYSTPLIGTPQVFQIPVTLRLLDATNGNAIWSKIITGTGVNAQTPLLNFAGTRNMLGLPTGLVVYKGLQGPEFVLKTTDSQYKYASVPFFQPTLRFEEQYNAEHLFAINAITGATRWQYDLTPDRSARYTNTTWITGAADLTGDGQPEIVLDQLYIGNPRGTEINSPLTGERAYQYERGMTMMALRGENGRELWSTLIFDEASFRPNLPLEEEFPVLLWTHGQIIGDFTGDGKSDPVALYLTRESLTPRRENGKFMMHVHPLNGENGKKLWPTVDTKVQGWGYLQSLQVGAGRVEQMAVGTVDLPTTPRAAGQFPEKDIRITVLRTADGSPEWQYRERFAQDSYLFYGLTLAQFHSNLAPYDFNGDGLLDPLTPSIYKPPGYEQLLITTQKHSYLVLDAREGLPLHEVHAWGANGVAVRCAGAERDLTVISGHSRRLDLTRVNVTNDTTMWSEHVWVDPTLPRAASSGFDMTFLQGKCWQTSDNRTFYVANTGLYSRQRGIEILPIRGLVGEGTIDWQLPPVNVSKEIADFLELSNYQARPPNEFGKAVGIGAGALLPGGLVGGLFLGARGRGLKGLLGMGLLAMILVGSIAPPVPIGAPMPESQPQADSNDGTPAVVPGSAEERFLDAIASDPKITAPEQARLMQQYMHESGYQTPAVEPGANFNENDSIAYTYHLGDVNQDGNDDVLLDVYCTADFSCDDYDGAIYDPLSAAEYFLDTYCGPTHKLVAQDGLTGANIWNRSLNVPSQPWPHVCIQDYVVGLVPRDGVPHVLVYRYQVFDATWPIESGVTYTHEFYLIDPRSHRDVWRFSVEGRRANTWLDIGVYEDRAENIIVNAIIQAPRNNSARIEPADVQTTLHLQSIGYQRTRANTIFGILGTVGIDDPLRLIEDYQPMQWAARIDPQTGKELWRANTFQPQLGRAVLPTLVATPITDRLFGSPANRHEHYWMPERCCSDLTGDKVPDLVYTTLEASTTPLVNPSGPHYMDARLVVFDGANGRQVYAQTLLKNHQAVRPQFFPQLVGDATGDGAADILLHMVLDQSEYVHRISMIDGPTGNVLWSHDSARDLRSYVLGDADGDGGNDLAVIFWFDHPSFGPLVNGFLTNVTKTPIIAYSGKDGHTLWKTESVTAAIDLAYMYRTFYVDGVPDVNGDRVGDLVIDDPLYLPDLTVVHRQAVIDGRNAERIFEYVAAGTFAFPTRAGDINGDGAEELGLLSGDISDLWITIYDVQKQEALWSRRILAARLANYFDAQPRIHFDTLSLENGTVRAFDVNLHFRIQTRVWSDTSIWCCDSSGGFGQGRDITLTLTYPRLAVFDGSSGAMPWSLPGVYDANLTRVVKGPTPASLTYERAIQPPEPMEALPYVQVNLVNGALIALGGFSFGLLFVYGLGRRLLP